MFRVSLFVLTAIVALSHAEEIGSAPRIVGGWPTTIYDYPHHVSLHYNGKHRCGGSIYSEKVVISASQCVEDIDATRVTIVAGATLLSEEKLEIPVAEIIMHPKYKAYNRDYDVAILVLGTPLGFGDTIQPIALAKERPAEGTVMTVVGWGALQEGGPVYNQLQKVNVNYMSIADCKKTYSSLLLTGRMLCAGVPGGGKDACQGDSGGPLIVDNQLLGIVSWGNGCARDNYPGVYSSVPDLYEWIVETGQ